MATMPSGRLLQVNVSDGGVPKRPVPGAWVGSLGVEGDRQADETVHGGPHRAVSILGVEAIRRVAAEGHPIAPGTTGENLTVEGFDVSALPIGTRLAVGDEVVLELSWAADPCRTIRHSFRDLRFGRLGISTHPDDSRMYARVVHEGRVEPGDPIVVTAPPDDGAEREAAAHALERSERASSLAVWAAAAAAGHRVEILDDGELAVAAAPELPGPAFNQGLGFAGLPHLLDRAREHFARHGVTGWAWADPARPPWPGARADATAVYAAATAESVVAEPLPPGLHVRQLGRDEVGAWARIVAEGAGLPEPVARAFVDLEPQLARHAHHHRFVAELDGRPVGAGSLHTHHRIGWLRAGTVLAEARGRGIQRALLAERAAAARRLGCEVVGASANEGGVSARNLERVGARTVALRARYRSEPPEASA
jgi:MOSC domain-containing protein YiiM/GNAT superfamily N-acetyltransferase